MTTFVLVIMLFGDAYRTSMTTIPGYADRESCEAARTQLREYKEANIGGYSRLFTTCVAGPRKDSKP